MKKNEDKKKITVEENKDLENLKLDLEKAQESWKRALADYQNLEKRTQGQRVEWIRSSSRDLILKLLPAIDGLNLAQAHLNDEGLKLALQKFLDILKSEGVEIIETENRDFDPNLMECVEISQGEDNKVLSEVRAGYILNGKVLRPAQVNVGKAHIVNSK